MRAALTALFITLSTQAFADIAECTVRQAVYINPGQVISDPEHEFIKKYFATKFMIFRSDTDVTLIKDGDNELQKYDFYKLLENSIESYWLEKNLSTTEILKSSKKKIFKLRTELAFKLQE